MSAKRILVPTDFSDFSKAALQHATSLARDTGATLLIVHVHEPVAVTADVGYGGFPIDLNEAERINELSEVKPEDPDIPVVRQLLTGTPAEEIIRYADHQGVEMIVMATHGRRGLARLLMGSVAESVVRQARCPVLTVKQPMSVAVES